MDLSLYTVSHIRAGRDVGTIFVLPKKFFVDFLDFFLLRIPSISFAGIQLDARLLRESEICFIEEGHTKTMIPTRLL